MVMTIIYVVFGVIAFLYCVISFVSSLAANKMVHERNAKEYTWTG